MHYDGAYECKNMSVIIDLQTHVEDTEEFASEKTGISHDNQAQRQVYCGDEGREFGILEIVPDSFASEDWEAIDQGEPSDDSNL